VQRPDDELQLQEEGQNEIVLVVAAFAQYNVARPSHGVTQLNTVEHV